MSNPSVPPPPHQRRPSFTDVIRPITHPTEVVERFRRDAAPDEPKHRVSPRLLKMMRRVAYAAIGFGVFWIVLMIPNRSLTGVVVGVLVVSGGFSVRSFEALLSPDVVPVDVRVWVWLRKWWRS